MSTSANRELAPRLNAHIAGSRPARAEALIRNEVALRGPPLSADPEDGTDGSVLAHDAPLVVGPSYRVIRAFALVVHRAWVGEVDLIADVFVLPIDAPVAEIPTGRAGVDVVIDRRPLRVDCSAASLDAVIETGTREADLLPGHGAA